MQWRGRVHAPMRAPALPLSARSPGSPVPTEFLPPAVILVVDGEAVVSRLVCRYLTHIGYRVLEASSGEQALVAVRLRQPPIDLVLADMVLPEMDGLELASAVLAATPGPSVLLMSGQLPEEGERIEVDGRIVQVTRKPVDFDQLQGRLQAILEGYSSDDEVESAHCARPPLPRLGATHWPGRRAGGKAGP